MDRKPICPVCGQSEQVEKVSSLYLVGLGLRRLRRTEVDESGLADMDLYNKLAASPELVAVSRKLAPPSSGKQVMIRPIHPDLAILVFSLIVPIFLYGMFTTQPGAGFAVLGLLAVVYAAYFWQRRRLITRFEAQQSHQRQADERTNRAVKRWMALYYCACDDWIFQPGEAEPVPVDQIMGYLYREQSE